MAKNVSGSLKVSNDVIADLAGYAAMQCYGVVGMATVDGQNGMIHLLPTQRLRKGIDVSTDAGTITVDLHVVVEQGVNIQSVSRNLEDSVRYVLASIADFSQVEVRIHVEGVRAR